MKLLSNIKNMISEKRLGFSIEEIMTGTHEFVANAYSLPMGGAQKFEFKITWGPESIAQWLNPFSDTFLKQPLKGFVTVGGLCVNTPCAGTLELRYLKDRKIKYSFDFKVKNTKYTYVGEKVNILPWNLPFSHTTCFGVLTESKTGKLISTSVTFFKMRTALKFLTSLRFV